MSKSFVVRLDVIERNDLDDLRTPCSSAMGPRRAREEDPWMLSALGANVLESVDPCCCSKNCKAYVMSEHAVFGMQSMHVQTSIGHDDPWWER